MSFCIQITEMGYDCFEFGIITGVLFCLSALIIIMLIRFIINYKIIKRDTLVVNDAGSEQDG